MPLDSSAQSESFDLQERKQPALFEAAYPAAIGGSTVAALAEIAPSKSTTGSHATELPDDYQPANTSNNQNAFYNGIASRFAFQSMSGQLEFEPKHLKRQLTKAGTVGQQLLDRMRELESNGWTFANLSINDPGLKESYPNPIVRTWKWMKTEGYNHDLNKRITVGNPLFSISRLVGSSYGTGSTRKENACILAHELSHCDGILTGNGFSDDADRPVFAKRFLATETRAVLTQLHVAEQIGHTDCDLDQLRTALKKNDLGGYIHDVWSYKEFKAISREQAVDFVNDYIDDTFGTALVDKKSGKISSFDIAAGLDAQVGATKQDHWLSAARQIRHSELADQSLSPISHTLDSGHSIGLGRALRSIAALGILGTISNLQAAFQTSPEHGVARLTRVTADWAGFESGNLSGGLAGRSLARFLPIPAARIILPIMSVSGGALGATMLDTALGAKLEYSLNAKTKSLAKAESESSLERLKEQLQ